MHLLGKIKVTTVIPSEIGRLKDIANNLWWSWNSEAIDLYREIDLILWEKLNKNPVRFIKEVSGKKLQQKISDPEYMRRYYEVVEKYDGYMNQNSTWFKTEYPEMQDQRVAYFSAEFGLNEVLPIYSGGLGVLSGDHCKSASDLGIPLTAVGLFYKQGYFNQQIDREGWQNTRYSNLNITDLPIKQVLDTNGEPLHVRVEMAGRLVYTNVWQVQVGRVSLYLLDSDTDLNNGNDRLITSRLYGGDQETRIQQEILLGIAGVRALEALGINPVAFHMNEGHSAFLGLELIYRYIQKYGLSFCQAKELVSASVIFTTHTPVPAGNDVFPLHMIDRYLGNYWGMMGISRHEFLDLGMKMNDSQNFNMTVLAMTLSGRRNGVSELHGAVTRNIYSNLWPGVPEEEVPVSHVTNGIHTLTWLSPNFKYLFDKYLPQDWQDRLYDSEVWEAVDDIPDEELWKTHCALKTKMIGFVRGKLKEQRLINGESPENLRAVDNLLDPAALTIGFARRFATYKRANLIFRNVERIKKILNRPDMPVQIIFAGKAHPADRPAHEVIKNINDISRQEGFTGKVILVENYNMTLSRNLIQGVDVWLNNPKRPLEASGTSGQKVCVNGIINFSVLDGWWCEGYNGKNGWAIGDDTYYDNDNNQDNADSESLYELLERSIVPLFYNREGNNIPVMWVKYMKESIKSLSFNFSTHRMLQDYTREMYIPSVKRTEILFADGFEKAIELAEWKRNLENNWQCVQLVADKSAGTVEEKLSRSGESINMNVVVSLGEIRPSDVSVELYYGTPDGDNNLECPNSVAMSPVEDFGGGSYRYSVDIVLTEGGEYSYTYRVVPSHPLLTDRFEQGLIKWAI